MSRRSLVARVGLHVERRIITWPPSVGLARMLGVLGLLEIVVEVTTYPFVASPGVQPLRAGVLVTIALCSAALLVSPASGLTLATSHVAVLGMVGLHTWYSWLTGALESPYLSGYAAYILVVALFATRRMTIVTIGVVLACLVGIGIRDPDPSGLDLATILTVATLCGLVGSVTSILASRQRRNLRHAGRRLRSASRDAAARRIEAFTDPLTGLRNRRALERDLADRARRATGQGLMVAMVDADGLKAVNDTLGHTAGDRLLGAVVDGVRSHVRVDDAIYRIGGDEFAVVVSGGDLETIAGRFGDHVEAHDPQLGLVQASVGVAIGGPDIDPWTLLSLADARMYESKQRRRPAGRPWGARPVAAQGELGSPT